MALVSMRQSLDHAAESRYGVPASNKDKAEIDPRKYLRDTMLAAKQICRSRFEAFGTAGQAAKLKPIALETMADKYARGEISAVVN